MPFVYRKSDKMFLAFNTKRKSRHNFLEMQRFDAEQEIAAKCREVVWD